MSADELLQAIARVIAEQQELEKWQRRSNASNVSITDGSVHAYDKIKELMRDYAP